MTGSLSCRLRETVLPVHRRIELLPFFVALTGRTLPVERYVDQLRAIAIVTSTLERAVISSSAPPIRTIRSAASFLAGFLLDDLAFFDRRGPLPDDPTTTSAALDLASEVLRAAEQPPRLLGHLYVLQGMTIGNIVHRDDAAACSGGTASGARWYFGHGEETGPRFKAFCSELDALPLEEAELPEVVTAARAAVLGLERIHAALDPGVRPPRRFLVTTFNPEAGSHDVLEEATEIAAAFRAGDRCLEEYPYILERWGDRGHRYTRSDVLWLASLAGSSREDLLQQVRWLAGILARRGMPSLLLERQLVLLEAELSAAAPAPRWSPLGDAARELSAGRLAILSEVVAEKLTVSFVESVKTGTEAGRRKVAALLLSAVADESTGVSGTVEALTSWYQSGRFSSSWNDAVSLLLRAAFSAARRAGANS